jgi:hypothetical protein
MTARYQHVMQTMVADATEQLAAIFPSAAISWPGCCTSCCTTALATATLERQFWIW